ncbi:MAG: hypothetical protein ABSC60_02775 [Acidobacteriota bacterium]|jgi:hypothetical protein
MKKAAVIAGLFVALFLGSMVTAQAGIRSSFGFGIGIVPAVPYGYYYPPYPPYYYSDYYAYPYYYYGYYPYYRTYVVPRYYGNGRYPSYYYRDGRGGNRWLGGPSGRSMGGSRPGR